MLPIRSGASRAAVVLLGALCFARPHAAAAVQFRSGAERATVIELFTSEGCSSCPPAEAFLNGFAHAPALWTTYIPMAFHVGYWDHLGWRDRFAALPHARRQRRYARLHRLDGVYTPAFVVNGDGWRPRRLTALPVPGARRVGDLRVRIDGNRLTASFVPVAPIRKRLVLNIAVLGMDLRTRIRAGENRGRRVRHDFVVLALKKVGASGNRWHTALPAPKTGEARRLAVAVWLNVPGDPTPIQATGGYLPEKGGGDK